MKAAHLREKNIDDLVELRKSLVHDIFENRLKNFTNRLDDTSMIRKTKRDLARVVTLLHERELSVASSEKPATEAAQAPKSAKAANLDEARATTKASKKSSKKSEAKS